MAIIESGSLLADIHSLSAQTPEVLAKAVSRYIISAMFPRRSDLDKNNCGKICHTWLQISKAFSDGIDETLIIHLLVDAIVLLQKYSGDPIIDKFINQEEENHPGAYCMDPCTTFVAALVEAIVMRFCATPGEERDLKEDAFVKKFSSTPFKCDRDSLRATLADIQVVIGSPLFTRHDSAQAEKIAKALVNMPRSWRRRARRDVPDGPQPIEGPANDHNVLYSTH